MVYMASPGMVTCRREDKQVSEERLGVEVVISPERAPSVAGVAHCQGRQVLINGMNSG